MTGMKPYTPIHQSEITRGATFRYWCMLFIGAAFVFLSACRHNPVDSGNRFLAKPGPILFISNNSGTDQLYSMNEDGSNVQQLTKDPNFPILDAKWSPDGSKIAVVSLIGDSLTYPSFRRAIFIMNADGSHPYQLTPQWLDMVDSTYGSLKYGGAWNPVWSPDSRQIAYIRLMVPDPIGNTDIFVINIDGTGEKRITGTINIDEGPDDWLKDHNLILGGMAGEVIDSTGNDSTFSNLTSYNLEGKMVDKWGKKGELWCCQILSRDERKIAFNSRVGVPVDIYVANLSDSVRSNLTNGICEFTEPVDWSPDDREILFNGGDLSNGHTYGRIFEISISTGNVTEITPFSGSVYSLATSWR